MLKINRSNSVQWKVARSLLVVTVLALAVLVSATATFATTRHVSLTGTDWIGPSAWNWNLSCPANQPCRNIDWAVTWAQKGDLIFVHEGHYVEQPITVSKNLTIQGVGAYPFGISPITWVEGNQQGSVFTIEPGVTATIQSMIIANGTNGIHNRGTLGVQGCLVGGSQSTAKGQGSGIHNDGGTLLLGRVWVLGNQRGPLNSMGSATLDEVWSFSNGTGIRNETGSTLAIANSAIWLNQGEGVLNAGTLTMLNVTVSGNHWDGLYVEGGNATLTYVTIAYNDSLGFSWQSIGTVTMSNSIVYGNAQGTMQCHSDVLGGQIS
jgi:hypothetical protein